MVPTFDGEGKPVDQSIARGRLTAVWLGGLVNPQALLTAMQQEKAVLVGKSIEEVTFLLPWNKTAVCSPVTRLSYSCIILGRQSSLSLFEVGRLGLKQPLPLGAELGRVTRSNNQQIFIISHGDIVSRSS
jgi:hypothetical protein